MPSEPEWTYATVGGSDGRAWPWGTTDPGTASQYAIYNCDYPDPTAGSCTSVKNIAPVGTPPLGAGRWGQLDLLGNTDEWNFDAFNNACGPSTGCVDCACLTVDPASPQRIYRGGDFHTGAMDLLQNRQGQNGPDTRGYDDSDTGFRCARTP